MALGHKHLPRWRSAMMLILIALSFVLGPIVGSEAVECHENHNDWTDLNWDVDAQAHDSLRPVLPVREVAHQNTVWHHLCQSNITKPPGCYTYHRSTCILDPCAGKLEDLSRLEHSMLCMPLDSLLQLLLVLCCCSALIDDAPRLLLQCHRQTDCEAHRVTLGSQGTHQRRHSLQKNCSGSLIRCGMSRMLLMIGTYLLIFIACRHQCLVLLKPVASCMEFRRRQAIEKPCRASVDTFHFGVKFKQSKNHAVPLLTLSTLV